jgi:O-antigen ligase
MGEARQCFEIFSKSPILGMGAGYTYHLFRQSLMGGGEASKENTIWVTNFTHSDLMFMLSKWGLVGVSLFFWFYFRITKLAWLVWKNASTPESRAKGLACFLFFIDALIIGQSTPVIQTRSDAFFLAVMMGYAYSLYHIYVAKPKKRTLESLTLES